MTNLPVNDTSRDLRGRRVLVTGASSGIGAATARLLAARGAAVAVHYRSRQAEAVALSEAIVKAGGRAVALSADLLDPEARRRLVPAAVEALGGLDALVNNAGGPIVRESLTSITMDQWRSAFELNVHAPFALAQQAFIHMQANGGGRIVNVSSIGVKYGGSERTLHYASAKAALETMALGLAKAGARHGILVNVVRPGVIDTPAHADLAERERADRVARIPVGHAGRPADVAEMIGFLLSSAADFITGQILAVSGGD